MTLVCPICGTGVSQNYKTANYWPKHAIVCCPHYANEQPVEVQSKPKAVDKGPLLPMFPDGMQPVKGKDYD